MCKYQGIIIVINLFGKLKHCVLRFKTQINIGLKGDCARIIIPRWDYNGSAAFFAHLINRFLDSLGI